MKSSPDDMIRRSQHGFTLIEILVALAILAIALTALIGSANTVSHNNLRLQNKTLALWIAEDLLNEKRISNQWPTVGQTRGSRTLDGQNWQWQLDVATTNADNIFKARATVSLTDHPADILVDLGTYFTSYNRSRHRFSNYE